MDVSEVLSILDDFGFEDIDTAVKVEAIQDAIWDVESRQPWPFLETSILLDFDGVGATATNQPSNFRASMRVHNLSPFRRLLPIRLDEVDVHMQDQGSLVDTPRLYYFEGGVLKLWPIPPSGTGTVRARYLRKSSAITSTTVESAILIPAQHHLGLLVNGALSKLLFDLDDDPEMAARKEAQFENRIATMTEELFRQQYDVADSILVVDPDLWDYHTL